MNSLFDNLRSGSSNKKEALIKKSIVTQLSDSVKEIQLFGLKNNLSGDSMDLVDASNTFCTIIEALFLHGLKDSLVNKAKRVVTGDVDQRPEPNFWSPLLIFSHRQIIDQITVLPNITTEIGQCRAWIRISLNDSLLSSYFSSFMQESEALKPFYKTFAFIRDVDMLDVARRLIEGVESCTAFELPCNSSLLNSWSLPALFLAGIWSSPLRQCPIYSAVDVAQSLDNTSESNTPKVSINPAEYTTTTELSRIFALNEDEKFQIILSEAMKSRSMETQTESDSGLCDSITHFDDEPSNIHEVTNLGNSLKRKSGWSFDENHTETPASVDVPVATTSKTPVTEGTKSMENSYHALIESYNLVSTHCARTPDLKDILSGVEENTSYDPERQADSLTNNTDMSKSDEQIRFESLNIAGLEPAEVNYFLSQIGKLAQEKGLDSQNFECFGCKHPLGINLCKARVCAFTGDCYCDSCMSPNLVIIPARIIHNWDFELYYVSKKVAIFLNDVKNRPLLDLKILNPYIYNGVEEIARLQSIRIQLNFLRDYLYTCREPVIEQFQRLIWSREYMYEHIHQYSISDLIDIPAGNLAQVLTKVVNFGRNHVTSCWLCSQKGFVCEVCTKAKALYPFDIENTFRCESCKAVYHRTCLDSSKPCPKCTRIRKREDLSLFDAM